MIFFPTAATSGAVISLLSYIMIFALLPIIIESFFQMMIYEQEIEARERGH
jgi:hypothetical protein